MIRLMKTIIATVLLTAVFVSCEQQAKTETDSPLKEPVTTKGTEQDTVVAPKSKSARIYIEKINAESFQSAAQNEKAGKQMEKITDFKTVQKLLAGTVEFKETDGYLNIKKIRFRNGTLLENSDQLSESTFAAYFPTEEILLLEGGHTTDVSFDLETGQTTYDAGNPDLVITSPTEKYRLNRVFEGQECFYHFLQENKNGKFRKIHELDTVFKKKFNKWLCIIEKGFWTDDETFYFREVIQYKETGNVYEYYKVRITGDAQ